MTDAGHELHSAVLAVLGDLMTGDPAPDSVAGKALTKLADAIEAYERATLPPPYGAAGVKPETGA